MSAKPLLPQLDYPTSLLPCASFMALTCFLKGVMLPFSIPNEWDHLDDDDNKVGACLSALCFLPLAQVKIDEAPTDNQIFRHHPS